MRHAASAIDQIDALIPPCADMPLPAFSWFQQFPFKGMVKLKGQTFVQIPHRLEDAFCEASSVALCEAVEGPGPERKVAGWKACLHLQ